MESEFQQHELRANFTHAPQIMAECVHDQRVVQPSTYTKFKELLRRKSTIKLTADQSREGKAAT